MQLRILRLLLLPITQRNSQVVLNCLTSALQEPLDPSVKAVRDGCRHVIILAFFSDYVAAARPPPAIDNAAAHTSSISTMAQMKKDFQRVLNDDAGGFIISCCPRPSPLLSLLCSKEPPPKQNKFHRPDSLCFSITGFLPTRDTFVRVQRCDRLRKLYSD
jgi:hypothetical protein